MTSRELVYQTLEFNGPSRAPRQLWVLPWAEQNHPKDLEVIRKVYPDDIVISPSFCVEKDQSIGDLYEVGEATDGWGSKFINYQKGIIGEVKEAIVKDDLWEDLSNVHIPIEWLTINVEKVNQFCQSTEQFVLAGCLPRPFEQLQFIRGTENLFVDLMLMPEGLKRFMDRMHSFYCELVEKWAKTDVDGIFFMDDWGSQTSLLINPKMWESIFKPMYKDYIDIAHKYGKKAFMHSDGYIADIYTHLVEIGLDALNSQIFCMDMTELSKYKGQITFWGEIDRQNILPFGTETEVSEAVNKVKDILWKDGGCIAQCEFGPGAKPENVKKVFETWLKN